MQHFISLLIPYLFDFQVFLRTSLQSHMIRLFQSDILSGPVKLGAYEAYAKTLSYFESFLVKILKLLLMLQKTK